MMSWQTRYSAREETRMFYNQRVQEWRYPKDSCRHWMMRKSKLVGHIQNDFRHHNSKALWVEVL